MFVLWSNKVESLTTLWVSRKYRRAQSIAKLILTLDNIVFIDTQVSKKVSVLHRGGASLRGVPRAERRAPA